MRFRLYIFDADGTLRETVVPGRPCPHAPGQWRLRRGVRAKLDSLPPNARIGIATNQDRVGYGLIDGEVAMAMLVALARALGRRVPREAIRMCPHAPEEGCPCRKPAPGMLRDVMDHYSIGPEETVFIGDASSDEEAARRAGVAFIPAGAFFCDARSA